MRWRRLPFELDDAGALLARGVALLEGLADDPVPTLRWYRASEPALVLGRGQAPLIRAGTLPVVTRYSGGGAVLLDEGLLSLDVLLPASHPWLTGDLSAVFDHVGRAWGDALRSLGIDDVTVHEGAATARRRGAPREQLLAAICYATLGRGEVTVGGRKVVGLSQRRRRPGALVQCGLLRHWQPQALLQAFGGNADDEEILSAAVGLDELMDDPPDDETLMAAVNQELEQEMTMTGRTR